MSVKKSGLIYNKLISDRDVTTWRDLFDPGFIIFEQSVFKTFPAVLTVNAAEVMPSVVKKVGDPFVRTPSRA